MAGSDHLDFSVLGSSFPDERQSTKLSEDYPWFLSRRRGTQGNCARRLGRPPLIGSEQ